MLAYSIRSFLLISLLAVTSACQQQKQTQTESNPDKSAKKETRLVLNNATLEQSNAQGQKLWKLKVKKAIYNKDRQKADLEGLEGDLFQDGKLVLKVTAKKGEVERNGEEVFLKEEIVATDPRNGAIIRSGEVEWRPKEDILFVRQNLKGSQAKLNVTAKEGKYYTRRQRLELIGQIIATTKDPPLQLKTEKLFWEIPQEKVVGHSPIQIVRYQGKTITDQVVADNSEVNLKTNEARLKNNVEFKSVDPPIQMASHSVIWQYQQRLVRADQPVQLIHHAEQVTITGNQAEVDLKEKVARVKGGAQGLSGRNQAKLYANDLIWNIASQTVEAGGNVIYQQGDPPLNLTGDKAVGNLADNSIVVNGNSRDRVVTEIFP